jgi:hypothetical protein
MDPGASKLARRDPAFTTRQPKDAFPVSRSHVANPRLLLTNVKVLAQRRIGERRVDGPFCEAALGDSDPQLRLSERLLFGYLKGLRAADRNEELRNAPLS